MGSVPTGGNGGLFVAGFMALAILGLLTFVLLPKWSHGSKAQLPLLEKSTEATNHVARPNRIAWQTSHGMVMCFQQSKTITVHFQSSSSVITLTRTIIGDSPSTNDFVVGTVLNLTFKTQAAMVYGTIGSSHTHWNCEGNRDINHITMYDLQNAFEGLEKPPAHAVVF